MDHAFFENLRAAIRQKQGDDTFAEVFNEVGATVDPDLKLGF
jgi:hypothetical protein